RRESLAYREILPATPGQHPKPWAVMDRGETCALLLDDLSGHRVVDQLDGLGADDAVSVAAALARLHTAWAGAGDRLGGVRLNTLASLAPAGLDAGLEALTTRWADVIGPAEHAVFTALRAAHPVLVERFGDQPVTLCHGDPRADNLVFDHAATPVLFDWQQMAVQFGEADLAWLAATSLTVETRRQAERDLVQAADGDLERYRLGLALPGLAVLFLAQRELPNERARRFVATSLQRIAAAVADNDTASLT
ncbi:MAG: phosphotransferase, partial [Actinomycetota bacterium]